MKSFRYMGKYKEESSLPARIQEGAVMFREPDFKKFAVIANILAFVILLVLAVFVFFYSGRKYNMWGVLAAFLLMVPHEFLHAIWMKGEVFMYASPQNMMLFVTSTEDLTKGRFIWMSLFPTICFGFIPLLLFVFNSGWTFLGYLGVFSISMGTGDFCNVFFAVTQMPKNSVTFLSGSHSYWYMPEKR